MKTFYLVFIKSKNFWVLHSEIKPSMGFEHLRAAMEFTEELKVDAKKKAIKFCQNYYKTEKEPCRLRIYDKDGCFQKERGYPRKTNIKR